MQKLFGVLALSLFLATSLFGQLTALSGTVTDPTGAVIPNAVITIINTQTGLQRATTSDAQGRYTMNELPPGVYKLTGKSPGFSEVEIGNIELLVSQPATLPVMFQKVGSTSTTVEVEAAATQINTVDASLGNALNTQQIVNLPSFGRNVAALLTFEPGVLPGGQVNGGKSDQGNITLDGADVNNQNNRAAMSSVLRVTLDSVQEFRVTTTNANADEGRVSGAQINFVTKSGTNALHGSLYEYRRGTETAANDYFNNLSGLPKPALLINIFGGTAGGPIKKDRIFYFINYEGRRDASASATTRTVPSDLLRQGILQYKNNTGGITQLDAAGLKAVDPAGIGINPASLALFNQYPHSNDSTLGDGLNFVGYRFSAPQHSVQNTYISRFDWRVDNAGKHMVFFRGQLQNDWSNGLPQFPGQDPASVSLNNSKGLATGYTATLKPNLIATTRYGFTRAGAENTGVLTSAFAGFRSLSTIFPTSTGTARIIPVHTLSQDFAWTHGSHDVRVGAIARFISNGSSSTANSFSSVSSNVSWLLGTGKDLQPANLASSFRTAYGDAAAATLGILPFASANYNYNIDGSVLPQGAPVVRTFNNQEYEWYVQDTWRVSRAVTITAGLRHSLMPPIYEANGNQTTATPSLNSWFYNRANLAAEGLPQTMAGPLSYVLANGPGGKDLYPNHLKNFAPRLALAYSPQGTDGLSKFLFGGPGKTAIRAGAGMFYDLVGQPLAQTYASTALGFSTNLNNPPSSLTTVTAPRFTGFYNIPSGLLPPAPPGGFPQTVPDLFAITNSIDDQLKAPYTINLNFSIGREFGHGFFVQGAYVGRLSRRSLVNQDLAEPTNLVDPKSHQTYQQAAGLAAFYANAVANKTLSISQVPNIPFFENLWPGLAGKGLTASQKATQTYGDFAPDYTSALELIDNECVPSCSIYGPDAMFNSQYSAVSTWSSVGKGNYHSMQWTVRKRFTGGLTLDFNFTYGKSMDYGSSPESGGSYAGLIQNAWARNQQWAVSDYDATFIGNFFAVWEVPVGHGRHFLSGSSRVVDALLGGWQIAPTYQQTSGTPVSVNNGRNWPTDWNLSPNAQQLGPIHTAPTKNATAVAGTGGPNLFPDPNVALGLYTFDAPDTSGTRNVLRSMGPFAINLGVSKNFRLFTKGDNPHQLQFRWESFNLTNSARFTTTSLSLGNSGTFGKYSADAGPRQMQFALKYFF